MTQSAGIFHRSAMWQQDTLSPEVESVHYGLRIVVAQNADDRNRVARKASQDQSLNSGSVNRPVFAVQENEIEASIGENLAQARFRQPDRTAVHRSAGAESLLCPICP